MKRRTLAVAFSGIAIATIIILFFFSSIIDVLDYTASAFAGLITTFVLIEFGNRYAVSVYLASSILSILLVPNKITPLLFILFCGWYSFLKRVLERLREPLCTVLKFLIFNASLIVMIILIKELFVFENLSPLFFVGIALLSNFTFFVYDMLVSKLIWLYVHKYKKRFKFLK